MVIRTTVTMAILTIVVIWSFVPRLLWAFVPYGHLYHSHHEHFDRVTDRQTDGQTDRQTDTGEFRFLDPSLSV